MIAVGGEGSLPIGSLTIHIPPLLHLKFLHIINAFLYQTGIPQQFDDQVELNAHVMPGVWIALIILGTLNGRSPLFHLSEYASTLDCKLLLGQDFDPKAFNERSKKLIHIPTSQARRNTDRNRKNSSSSIKNVSLFGQTREWSGV